MALGNMGSDFNYMGPPSVATDTSGVPGSYVNTSANASYGGSFSAGGSALVWFAVIMALAFVAYHYE